MIYLCHFSSPLAHAQHYLGFCEDEDGQLDRRIKRHKNGNGSKLLRAVGLAGIQFEVVRVWPEGSRELERKLKNRKKSRLLCPICNEKLKLKTEIFEGVFDHVPTKNGCDNIL